MIALSMILSGSENPEAIKRCLNSVVKWVDGAFITVTTEDENDIVELCEKYDATVEYKPGKFHKKAIKKDIDFLHEFIGDKVFLEEGDEVFQFDQARNNSLNMIPAKYDWVLWIDADDVFRGGKNLRDAVKKGERMNIESIFFNYLYQVDVEDGEIKNVLIEHLRERVFRNKPHFEWVGPIHETLISDRQNTRQSDSQACDVVHLSDDERRSNALIRNMKALELQIASDTKGRDPRANYYLGKAYFDHARVSGVVDYYDMALKLFEAYIEGTPEHENKNRSGWAEERSQCWEYMTEIYRVMGEHNNAIKCGMNALIEDEKFPSIYINIALSYVFKKEWQRALNWAKLAAKIPQPKSTLINNPRDNQMRMLEIIYQASINLSKLDEAWAAVVKQKKTMPDEPIYKDRYEFVDNLRKQRDLTKAYVEVANNTDKKEALALATPQMIKDNPIVTDFLNKALPPKEWEDDEVAIFCGPGFTSWSPKKLRDPGDSFIGGSEEAVILLSEQLAELGWKVTVYGDPGQDEGEYNGVTYLPYYKFNERDKFNILVAWRNILFLDKDLNTNKTYLWLHDVQDPTLYSEDRVEKIDKIFCLSPYHRSNIPNVADDKILITGNGINYEQ